MPIDNEALIELTADIAAAHVSHNSVPVEQIAEMIGGIYNALAGLGTSPESVVEKPKAAVSARASIKPDHLVSMIDGTHHKMLKRHIGQRGYTPESYREAFGLPKDYPMVAANYAQKRRELALKIGLGRKPKGAPKPARKPRVKKISSSASTDSASG